MCFFIFSEKKEYALLDLSSQNYKKHWNKLHKK